MTGNNDPDRVLNKRSLGARYENLAAEYLASRGYEIWERNYRCRTGEIDLIAMDTADGSICFIEVKYRKTDRYGLPSEAVSVRKQQKILAVSRHYLQARGLYGAACRYDVAEILGDRIRLIKNAFGGS